MSSVIVTYIHLCFFFQTSVKYNVMEIPLPEPSFSPILMFHYAINHNNIFFEEFIFLDTSRQCLCSQTSVNYYVAIALNKLTVPFPVMYQIVKKLYTCILMFSLRRVSNTTWWRSPSRNPPFRSVLTFARFAARTGASDATWRCALGKLFYRVMSKRSKSKFSTFLPSMPCNRSIFCLVYKCIVVPIAPCIPVQLWWINAVGPMCVTILNFLNRRLLESIDFWLTAFWHNTVERYSFIFDVSLFMISQGAW